MPILCVASLILILISISSVSAFDNSTQIFESNSTDDTAFLTSTDNENMLSDASSDLTNKIKNGVDGEEILLNPGTYKIHNIKITKSITLQGKGDPRNVIIDGEEKSSIFMINDPNVHVTFKNITFINGLTSNFGGAISTQTGNVYVDNCIFINNTALDDTNAGAISNYGTKQDKAYLLVNNSLFINNHADHDGGAITTCYANSDIYNCVFINNSAHRDGGAIRVSIFGYGNVQDCIFMFNHADEWGGAYYSWSGESNIERCIFMNNTAGTNGGAVMVSGNINLEDSIITNNDGGETGGSFYIQQPMYDTKTVINVHNNIITNNSSPYGKEIFIKWWDSYNLYTQFDDNDWGDEDPNDPSVNDPNNVTPRSKVSRTIKSDLFDRLSVGLLNKYRDLLGDYFTDDSLENLQKQFGEYNPNNGNDKQTPHKSDAVKKPNFSENDELKTDYSDNNTENNNLININTDFNVKTADSLNKLAVGNSTSHGEDNKAYELNETGGSVAKQTNIDIKIFIAIIITVLVLLAIGYRREKKMSK